MSLETSWLASSGFVLGKKMSDAKSKRSKEDSSCWETKAKFQNITLWNHDSLPSENDASLRAFHLFSVATAVSFFLILVTWRCLSAFICLIFCQVAKCSYQSCSLDNSSFYWLVSALTWHPGRLKYFFGLWLKFESILLPQIFTIFKFILVLWWLGSIKLAPVVQICDQRFG